MAAALDKGAEAGWLRPVIAQEFPLAEAAAAQSEVIKHTQGTAGKLILSV
jgi:NADPH:quinone reductase-like Zn-dependent oxidoreductase